MHYFLASINILLNMINAVDLLELYIVINSIFCILWMKLLMNEHVENATFAATVVLKYLVGWYYNYFCPLILSIVGVSLN